MHHRTVEILAAGDSPVHQLDARVKVIFALAFVIAVAALPDWPLSIYLPAGLLIAFGLGLAGLPAGFVLTRLLTVLPFVVVLTLFLPFTRGQQVWWQGPAGLVVYVEGSRLALVILTKGALAILGISWLVLTTPFHRLLRAFRALGVPLVIVTLLGFLFRYLDLMADESQRARRARAARSPAGLRRWRTRSTGGMIGRLFLCTLERADRVHRAMLSRGYDGEIRLVHRLCWRTHDGLMLLLLVMALGLAIGGGLWLGGRLG